MCVLIEAISVVVRRETIQRAYPDGLAQYDADCPNPTFCADDDIASVGFMSPYDVQRWVTSLEQLGITLLRDEKCSEIAIVDQVRGPTAPCDWLEFGRQPKGYTVAWLTGTVPREMVVPKGWDEEISLSQNFRFIPTEEIKTATTYLGREGNLDTFIDSKTGVKYFMGRPAWND